MLPTVHRVSRSCELFLDGFDLHLILERTCCIRCRANMAYITYIQGMVRVPQLLTGKDRSGSRAGRPSPRTSCIHCRANMAHIRLPRPDAGLGFQGKVHKTFQAVPSSLLGGRSTLVKSLWGGVTHWSNPASAEVASCLSNAAPRSSSALPISVPIPLSCRKGSGSRVQGSGFKVQGAGFRVQGALNAHRKRR